MIKEKLFTNHPNFEVSSYRKYIPEGVELTDEKLKSIIDFFALLAYVSINISRSYKDE